MTTQIKEPVKTQIKVSVNVSKVPDEIIVTIPHTLGHYEYKYTINECKSITYKEE